MAALKRSWALINERRGRIFALVFVWGLLAAVLSYAVGAAMDLVGIGKGEVSKAVANQLAAILVAPCYGLSLGLVYFNMREEKEGHDLLLAAHGWRAPGRPRFERHAAVGAALPVDAARVLAERDRILAAPEFNPAARLARAAARVVPRAVRGDRRLASARPARARAAAGAGGPRRRPWPGCCRGRASGTGPRPPRADVPAPAAGFAGLRADALLALAAGPAGRGGAAGLAGGPGPARPGRRLGRPRLPRRLGARRGGPPPAPDLAGPLADLALEFQRSPLRSRRPRARPGRPLPGAARRRSRGICVAEPAPRDRRRAGRARSCSWRAPGPARAAGRGAGRAAGHPRRRRAVGRRDRTDRIGLRHRARGGQGRLPAAADAWATGPSGGPSRWAICAGCAWRSCWPRSRGWAASTSPAIGEWIEAGGTLVYGPATFEPDAELLREGLELPELEMDPHPETEVPLVGDWAPARRLALRTSIARRDDPPKGAVAPLARAERRSWAL